jgi:cold shock CspA family protein
VQRRLCGQYLILAKIPNLLLLREINPRARSSYEKHRRIKNILSDKKYGFVYCDTDGRDYFLHFSEFNGSWSELKKGQYLEFEPIEHDGKYRARNAKLTNNIPVVRQTASGNAPHSIRIVGDYSGPTLNLTDDQRLSALREISRWKLEAKLDDIKRYFFSCAGAK